MIYTHRCGNRFCGKTFKADIRMRWANCPYCDCLSDSVLTPRQRLNIQYRGAKRSSGNGGPAVVFRNLDPKTRDETPYLYPAENTATHVPGFPHVERVELDSLAKLDAHYRETGKYSDVAAFDGLRPETGIDSDDGTSDPDADLLLDPDNDYGVGLPE